MQYHNNPKNEYISHKKLGKMCKGKTMNRYEVNDKQPKIIKRQSCYFFLCDHPYEQHEYTRRGIR